QSRDVVIEGNEIYSISNEAIDVKRHVTNVTIRHNLIHDVTPFYGGAISLGLNKNSWGPANYLVEHNRIWSVRSGLYYAQAIAVAHGPTIIRNNLIWDIETNPSDTWPWTAEIQVHGDDNDADWAYGFGNPAATRVVIEGNTVIGCRQACISSHTDDGQIRPDLTVADNIVDQPSGGDAVNPDDIVVAAADLLGPVTGTADSGDGPGSGLAVPPADEDPPTTPTSQTPATSTSAPATSTTSTTQPPTDSTAATTSATTSATTTPSTTDSTVAPGAVDTDLDTVKDIVTTTDTAIEPLLGTAAETTADGVAEPGIGGSGGKPLRVTDTDHDPAHDAAPSNSADAAPSSSAAGSIAPSRSGADSRSAATFVWSANRADSRGDSPTRGVHGSGLALTKRPPTFGRDRQHRIRVQEFAGFEAGDLSLETVSRLLVAPDQ
ncbi:MAG: right-handed parallel beta-helix repeat-containing protein, partial [Acidimicrobiia bacterium]|nr:right-handed parallel beta-helix repeat-containing protein [Acidimicrobiia bacterium]